MSKNNLSKLERIVKKAKLTDGEIEELAKAIKKPDRNIRTYRHYFSRRHTKIGVISDSHIGHKMFDEKLLLKAFKYFKREGVEAIYHAGDILEGMSGREGHVYELSHIGAEQQLKYAEELLKQTEIPIYAILGNHDEWFIKKADIGLNIGKVLERRLSNFHYLGVGEADVLFAKNVRMKLFHGTSGTAYAICFDDKTEILTENGWKLFKDLKKGEKVATLNLEKDEFEWQEPKDYIEEDYKGEMIHFSNRVIDCMVTPNHRMLVRRAWRKKWVFVNADNIKPRQWKFLRTIPNWRGKKIEYIELPLPDVKKRGKLQNFIRKVKTIDFMRFLGWFISEGNIGHKNKCVEINQSKEKNKEKYEEIVSLIDRIGFTYYCTNFKIKVTSIQLYEMFKNTGKCYEKRIPSFVKELDREYLLHLLETLFKGDGTFKNGKIQNYITTSKNLADDIQEIVLKCGLSCVIKRYNNKKSNFKSNYPIYQISIGHKLIEPEYGIEAKRVFYKGKIYCVKVPNEVILVRRNGKVIWTGNSYKPQKMVESFSGGDKPNIFIEGHYHKALYMFLRNVHSIEAGTVCGQTSYMRRRNMPAHKGFWVLDIYHNRKGVDRLKLDFIPSYD